MLKILRLATGMTQQKFADKLGISRSAVAMWESGLSNPKYDQIPIIANILGCSVNELFQEID